MSPSPSTEVPVVAFACDCEWFMRPACEGEPFYGEYGGKQYCVLHFPGKGKGTPFTEALKRKIANRDYYFSGVCFPDGFELSQFSFDTYASFDRATFFGPVNFYEVVFDSTADFTYAKFIEEARFLGCTYKAEARFFEPTFKARAAFGSNRFNKLADFTQAKFEGEAFFGGCDFSDKADFVAAKFGGEANYFESKFDGEANFDAVTFCKRVDFSSAVFNNHATFTRIKFDARVNFNFAIFKDFLRLSGRGKESASEPDNSVSLWHSKIEKPDRVSFHTLTLRPHWFVNVDVRKFEFVNIEWWGDFKHEIESLKNGKILSPPRLLSVTCRQLAVNAEENHRYEEASRFRYMAMEARRLERWRGFAFWTLGWWYWLASGYGERVWRAFVVLVGVWLVAAALYMRVGFVRWEPRVSSEREAAEARRDEVGEPLRWQRALTYSLGVMTLQKPEPRPATNAAQALVMLETILGPVQAALLALAIRRKFMR